MADMVQVNIHVRDADLQRQLRRLAGDLAGRASSRAINRALRTTKTAASRMIRQDLNLKARTVNKALSTHRATTQSQRAVLRFVAKPVGLIEYGARQTAKGTTFKVLKRGSRKTLRHAFVRTMKTGHRGVFEGVENAYQLRETLERRMLLHKTGSLSDSTGKPTQLDLGVLASIRDEIRSIGAQLPRRA